MIADLLKGKCLKYELVGSRVTCDPAPTDTDQDVLVLTTPELWDTSLFLNPCHFRNHCRRKTICAHGGFVRRATGRGVLRR